MKKINFGIIGYSHIHVFKYAPIIANNENINLVAIADNSKNKKFAIADAKKYKCKYYNNFNDFFSNKDLEAIYIGTEPYLHKDVIKIASSKRMHILCDKPLALNLEDASEIIKIAEKNNVKLMVPFNPRYQLPVMKAKKMIEKKEIGKLQYIFAVKYGKIPIIKGIDTSWFFDLKKAGAGGFGDIGIHAIDAVRWLAGSEAKSVYANIGTKINNINTDDIGQMIIEFKNNVIAYISSGWANPKTYPSWLDVRFEILGTKSAINIEKPYHDYAVFDKHNATNEYWRRRDIEMLVKEFVDSITENRSPAISGKDAYAALEIMLAAYKSAKTGKVVRIIF